MANPPMRPIKSITIKRLPTKISPRDYGHWWFEFDDNESYGWYPTCDPGLWDTLRGVPGELNGITAFGGLATKIPIMATFTIMAILTVKSFIR
jgi:hypothetical protein